MLAIVVVTWLSMVVLIPIVWITITSFKPQAVLNQLEPVFAFTPTWDNYVALFAEGLHSQIVGAAVNSIIVASVTTVLSVALSTLAAYSLSRLRPRGHRKLLIGVFALRMLPPVALIVPFFLIARWLNAVDTLPALFLPYTALAIPLGTWMLYGFFLDLPQELEEAAMLDGASRFQAFVWVILPLAGPGLAAVSIFSFSLAWNDLVLALPLTKVDAITLPVVASLVRTDQGVLWGQLGALTVVIMLPMVVFTLLVQRWLVSGLSQGAVKG